GRRGRRLSFLSFPRLRPTFRASRTKRRNSISSFPFTTFPISFRGVTKCLPCLQPFTQCCNSRLRRSWQRDRDARAQGRVQRVVREIILPQLYVRTLDAIALVLSCVGILCWAVCFWWMHRISSRQDALLEELHEMTRRIEKLSRREHDLISDV